VVRFWRMATASPPTVHFVFSPRSGEK